MLRKAAARSKPLEAIRAAGVAKARAGERVARNQDVLYAADGAPGSSPSIPPREP
jgi:hypothetical protein